MHKNKAKSNLNKIIIIGVIIILLVIMLTTIIKFENSPNNITLNTTKGMNKNLRLQDFNDMCDFIEKNIPSIYDYENLYGISYMNIIDSYYEQIKKSETDFEYYTLLKGFINNIPSGHLTMGYPDINYIPAIYQYRTDEFNNLNSSVEYWNNLLIAECRKYYNIDYSLSAFYYINGEYVQSEYSSYVNNNEYEGATLISIDDVPIDEFIKLYPSEYKLTYDHQNNKPFREIIIFNNICGTECTIKYRTDNGDIISQKMYYGIMADEIWSNIDYFYSIDNPSDLAISNTQTIQEKVDYSSNEIFGNNAYAYNDIRNNTLYMKFNDFTYGGAEALNILNEKDDFNNIIIDLRDNTGGMDSVCNALIEQLINTNINYNKDVYITYSDIYFNSNYILTKSQYLPFKTRFNKMYLDERQETFTGQSNRKINIYVLVSYYTLSAADKFSSVIQDNDLGTIIGAYNTSGEAYGSPDIKILTKSGLYFYFTPNKSLNKNGTDSSVYGTSPDIYISIDSNIFNKRDKLLIKNIDCNTYENRLIWDDVLIKTLEIIKEKENEQTTDATD